MPDTPRTTAALLALFADNTSGDISAQDARDMIVSGPIGTDAVSLLLSSFLATGADPSTTGAVRLSLAGAVKSRNAADSADITQLQASSFVESATTYDSTILAKRLLVDPDLDFQLAFMDGMSAIWTDQALANYDGVTLFNDRNTLINSAGITVSDADGALVFEATMVNGATPLQFKLGLLPTSDPNVLGRVYSMDSGGLAAELAAGSRYLLISNGP